MWFFPIGVWFIQPRVNRIVEVDAIKSTKSGYQSPKHIIKSRSYEILFGASNSDKYLERWAVALNKETPKDLLEFLANDKSYYVSSSARKRLSTNAYPESDELND